MHAQATQSDYRTTVRTTDQKHSAAVVGVVVVVVVVVVVAVVVAVVWWVGKQCECQHKVIAARQYARRLECTELL